MSGVEFDFTTDREPECSTGRVFGECRGEVFARTSRSGMTRSFICEGRAQELDEALDAIERRYPEINHPDYCDCAGCIGDAL
jgi:hypothetical protein